MGTRDLMKIDTPPSNEKFGGEDEIAAEIERLKKEQEKAQIKTKLHHLRKHNAQRFVKDVPEQKSYAQKLALESAKKVRDPNVYLGKSQHAFDKYINQVDLVFQTKPLTYASKEAKCLYAAVFLSGIPQRKWVVKDQSAS